MHSVNAFIKISCIECGKRVEDKHPYMQEEIVLATC